MLIDTFTKYYDSKDSVREIAFRSAREISKASSAVIRKLHGKENSDLKELKAQMQSIKKKYKELITSIKGNPEIYYSTMLDNYIQEYSEATIMLALIENKLDTSKLPDPDKLQIQYTCYLLGLADVIGEFRRCTLDALRDRNLEEANKYLKCMEEIYDIIINLNYTDKVLPLRRKQDIARALIEKTRSELVVASGEYNLVENITDLKKDLTKYYKNVVRKD
jgi:translin